VQRELIGDTGPRRRPVTVRREHAEDREHQRDGHDGRHQGHPQPDLRGAHQRRPHPADVDERVCPAHGDGDRQCPGGDAGDLRVAPPGRIDQRAEDLSQAHHGDHLDERDELDLG